MRFKWLEPRELDRFSTAKARQAALQIIRRRVRFRHCFFFFLLGYVPIRGLTDLGVYVCFGWLVASRLAMHVAIAASTAVAVSIGVVILYRKHLGLECRKLLAKAGIPICAHCGYDLRGQTVPRCPECGREFDERLMTRDSVGTPDAPPRSGGVP
jgi:hypothetical protein